jgi:hypothetical protein
MRLRGLEPPRGFPHTDLNRARLPNFATAAWTSKVPTLEISTTFSSHRTYVRIPPGLTQRG